MKSSKMLCALAVMAAVCALCASSALASSTRAAAPPPASSTSTFTAMNAALWIALIAAGSNGAPTSQWCASNPPVFRIKRVGGQLMMRVSSMRSPDDMDKVVFLVYRADGTPLAGQKAAAESYKFDAGTIYTYTAYAPVPQNLKVVTVEGILDPRDEAPCVSFMDVKLHK